MKRQIGILLVCLLGVLGACRDEESEMKPAEKVSRTVLAYIIGDNGQSELSPLLRQNFDDMVKGMADVEDADCNMLVYSVMKSEAPCLIRLKKQKGKVIADTLFIYDGNKNPLNKEVMEEIIGQAFNLFPAASYGFVFLSHAEGWVPATTKASRSIGAYRNTSMDIDEFREVLSNVGKRLDFVLFDACFMQSVEVAYELRDHVDYFIGSPTEIPGPGAPYAHLVKCFFTKDNTAIEIANAYFTPYAKRYTGRAPANNNDWTGGVSISVIRGDALDDLAESTKRIISEYGKNVPASQIMCYDQRSSKFYYDLNGLIYALTKGNHDYVTWKEIFMKSRPYWQTTLKNYSGSNRMFSMDGAEGVSIYRPSGADTSKNNTYYRTYKWAAATGWGN